MCPPFCRFWRAHWAKEPGSPHDDGVGELLPAEAPPLLSYGWRVHGEGAPSSPSFAEPAPWASKRGSFPLFQPLFQAGGFLFTE